MSNPGHFQRASSTSAASRSRTRFTAAALGLISSLLRYRRIWKRRVAPARYRAGAPSEPCVPDFQAHGSSKPYGR
jgi:hypothetical protein